MTDYPHCVVVQFRNDGDLGTKQELEWRHEQERYFEALLNNRVAIVNGGQSGAGTMEIFINTTNLEGTFDLIIRDLTDRELIGFARVAGWLNWGKSGQLAMTYPTGATFNFWNWDQSGS